MPQLRQNTATSFRLGPLVAATDGYTYLATTITLSASNVIVYKADGTVTELVTSAALAVPRPGWLLITVAPSDVTLAGRMTYAMGNATGNLPVWRDFDVVSAQPYDSVWLGNDFLQVDVREVSGAAPSAAIAGFGIHVSSVAAGVGIHVTSVAAGVGVNASSINGVAATSITFNANVLTITGAAVSAAFAGYVIPVNTTLITGAAVSAALAQHINPVVLDYVMFTPGAQTITVKDALKAIAAAAAGQCSGATGTAMVFRGPSGEVRVSGAMVSGNRTGVSWVTG